MRRLSCWAALRRPSCWAALRPAVVLALLRLALATAVVATSAPVRPAAPTASPSRPAHDVLASLPVSFEPAGDETFVSRGPGYSLVLTPSEAKVAVRGGTFRLRPAGPTVNPAARLAGGQPLGSTVTRLVGDDPSAWTAGHPAYGRVEARQMWPGVDMVWHGDQRRLEHDLVVAPGVDPAVVALDVDGAVSLTVDEDGDLVVDLGGTAARLGRPAVYQDVAGARRQVPATFTLLGPSRIGFTVGAYDTGRPLVIDPTLVTSTFLGGVGNDSGYAVALDAQGNTYVTGSTESVDFPTNAPLSGALANSASGPTSDVFVSKLSADGSKLIWSTYLGGNGRDTGYAVAVGADGTVYVAGATESPDFPRARAAQDAYGTGGGDAFVAKIAANGTGLDWATFLGGSGADRARGVAVDSTGNAYVVGSTSSVDFPAVNAYQPGPFRPEDLDAFVAKVPAAGSPLMYSTRLGGSNDDRGLAVAVDAQGNAYLTGDTLSPGFPTVRPIQSGSGGSAGGVGGSFPDAFVSKLNPNGSALIYSTFLGGSDFDQGTAVAVDAQGAAYVSGNTNSPNFPTAGPLQATKGNDADAFVAKIDPPGGALAYSTYVGGSGADGANGIAVDRAGNAHVVGTTGSANWPTARPTQGAKGGSDDAFVLKLDANGRGPLFSTFLGGREADSGMGVVVDARGAVRVLGLTSSPDFPSVKPVQGSRPAAGGDAFVATVDLADATTPAPTTVAAAPPAASSSSSAHDRRVKALGGLTLALLAAAILQTIFLRRRAPVPAAAPRPPVPRPSAAAGLKVLGDLGGGSATKKGAPAKASVGSKSTRTPKARGGPKTAGDQRAGPQKTAGNRKTPARPKATSGARPGGDDGGPGTVATPAATPPRPKPQEPAIAQLLEEDLWGRAEEAQEPEAQSPPAKANDKDEDEAEARVAAAAPPEPPEPPEPPAASAAPQAERQAERADEVDQPAPATAIPPVPAEELSFWDLFPEDLPPARPATVPTEDLLTGRLPLPEGPDSAASQLIEALTADVEPEDRVPAEPGPEPAQPSRPPRPQEAEIVIAELLDGPVPTGLRPSAESPWAPPSADDFVISELLAAQRAQPAPQDGTEQDGTEQDGTEQDGDEQDGDDGNGDGAPPRATAGRDKDEQARIAADRARRRRSRRSGRRRPGSG